MKRALTLGAAAMLPGVQRLEASWAECIAPVTTSTFHPTTLGNMPIAALDFSQASNILLYVVAFLAFGGLGYAVHVFLVSRRDQLVTELSATNENLRAEVAVRQRHEQELDCIFSQSLDMLCILGFDGYFKRFNPACTHILGWSPEELLARSYIVLVHPDDLQRTQAEIMKVAGGANTVLFEIRVLCKDGSYRWMLWNSTPIHNTNTFYAAGRDITERKRAEEAAHAGEERFRQLAETINEVFWLATANMREILYVSPAYEEIWGRSCEDLKRNPQEWLDAVHPEDRQQAEETLNKLFQGEPSVSVDYRVLRPDGSIRWVTDRGYQVLNEAGKVYRTAGIVSDVTEHKRMERHLNLQFAIRLALAESSSLEQAAPRILQIICEMLGWDVGQLWNVERQSNILHCQAVWHKPGEGLEEFAQQVLHRSLAKDEGLPGRVWTLGEPVWMGNLANEADFPQAILASAPRLHGALAFPIFSGSEVSHVIGFFSGEISAPENDLLRVFVNIGGQLSEFIKRTQLEQQLIQSQKMETVGRLAGGIAHEFNSIMTAIIGQSELLLTDLPPKDPLSKKAEVIRDAANRAASLTRQLLAYGRQQVLRPVTMDLNKIISGMEEMFRHLLGGDVDLRFVPCADLKGVNVDKGQIEQVLLNIVINARDAMPHGGKLTLETSHMPLDAASLGRAPDLKPGQYVMIAITDTGFGMSPDIERRIFEPFFSTKGVGRGTGLGLATCHGILKQSGGHITVYSELGKGTTFKLYLPQAGEQEVPISMPRNIAQQLPGGDETILLVEDDAALRKMASTLLGRLGYSVLIAANGAEALTLAEQSREKEIDLLFTDLVMPQVGGEELSERLLAAHPKTKVLFASAYAENALLHQSAFPSSVALLPKPFSPAALAQKVRELLDHN